MGVDRRQLFKRSLLYFLPLTLLCWTLVGFYLFTQESEITDELKEDAGKHLTSVQLDILEELDGLLEDLRLIASHEDLRSYLGQESPASLRRLATSWNQFSAAKRLYDQVRFIDRLGQERVRINYAGGTAVTVPDQQLQIKADRYYFKDSIGLQRGQLLVSPLDLNIEQGRIEYPLKPMLRLATPVFINGERQGVVVLNYLAKRLLRHLKAPHSETGGRNLWLNKEGYYLHGANADEEWGFMYPQRSGKFLFQDRFPAVWSDMHEQGLGQYLGKQGLFTYAGIQFPSPLTDWNGSQPQRWILVHHLTPDTLEQALNPVRRLSLTIGISTTLLMAALSFYLAYLTVATRNHQRIGTDLRTRLHTILTTAPDAIVSFNGAGRLESVNPAAERMFGCSFEQMSLMPAEKLLPGIQASLDTISTAQKLQENEGRPGILRRELEVRKCDGEILPVEMAVSMTRLSGENLYTGILRDISERREAAERIRRQSYFDELTKLPNRAMLQAEMQAALDAVKRRRMFGALLFMDLDNFKTINDSLGHQAGDLLLKQVARRIQDCLRTDDLVARLGGDEFVVLLPFLNTERRKASLLARDIAEKLRSALNRPIALDDHNYVVTPSIGIVLFPDTADDTDGLLKQADTAMYRAKAAGRNTIRLFQPRMQAEADALLSITKELRNAIMQEELILYFQPQVDASTGFVIGAEALVRWQHPERGLLSPGVFMDQAEQLGLSGELGDWVLQQALVQLSAMLKTPSCNQLDFLAVNISPQHFRRPDFLQKLTLLMEEQDVSPERLELEITENLLLQDIDEAAAKMSALKEMGIRFAIDDFGTGFSSLSYLRRLPLTRLKIDRSFVDGVHKDTHNASIVDTIIAMARIQRLELTAEGVETAEEQDWLLQRGCRQIQGYLHSRPVPLGEFIDFCASRQLDTQDGEALT
jgi:diguanylate cyclase (GGDEF)-like protein/PAS domain S-box-containing protein